MWRVSWQDYQGWRTADLVGKRPEVGRRDFIDKAEADAFAAQYRAAKLTVCVTPTPSPKRLRYTKAQTAIADPPFNRDWRLHK